jgi:transposase InsO family protein/transposase-like protein
MLLLAMASAAIKLREETDLIKDLIALNTQKDLKIRQLEQEILLLRARMSRIDAKHRSRYTPEERFNILVHKETYSLTLEQTAQRFLVSAQTIKRWFDEALREPTKKTIGSLLKAVPPLTRYSDVTRNLVCLMEQMGFGGCKRIAQTLTRAGIKLSRETVRRYRKQPRQPRPNPKPTSAGGVLIAKRPNHIWMMDITHIPSMLSLFTFKLVVLIDVFSRFPLAAKLFFKEPTGAEVSALIRAAARKHGPPRHFISDKGSQFTSIRFRFDLRRLAIKQRHGAILKTGSISTIERLWRTLKDMLRLRSHRAWTPGDLIRRLEIGLLYYAMHKPHQGLAGATPAEVYFGFKPAHSNANRPLREYQLARKKRPPDERSFEIAYLDQECLLPVLVPTSKAA